MNENVLKFCHFLSRFSGPGELRRLLTHTIEFKTVETIISCLQTLKISAFYLKPLWRKNPDKETL